MDIDILSIAQKEIIPGFKGRLIHSKNMTTAFWEIEKGSVLPLHSHMHEQISMVTSGEFEMTIDGIKKIYKPGVMIIIPSHTEHSGIALTHCTITDIFSPVRDDYR